MKKNQRSRRQKATGKKQQQPAILAEAIIRNPLDTDILQKDLPREFQPDPNNQDQSFLVNGKWVRFFDTRSSFLKGMMASVMNSTTQGNVIAQKTAMTLGDGFQPFESFNVPILRTFRRLFKKLTATDSGIEEMNALLGNVNLNNETLEEVITKVAFDWWAFGNAIVELVRTKRSGKDVVLIYHVPLHTVAIKKANENNIIKAIGVAENWEIISGSDKDIREIPIYNPTEDNPPRTAIHIKNYFPGFFYWGLPENISGRFWQEIEYRIPKYNIAKFKNGFVPSAILQFFGSLTQEEAKKLVKNVEDTFTDTGKNSKMLIQVLTNEKYKLDATILEDTSDGNYMDLSKLASQGVITSNRWTMSLAGFATGGKLGTNQQIRDEFEFVTNTVIKPGRRTITEKIINPFVKENAKVNTALQGIMLQVANMNPISLASSLDPKLVLSKNEQREIFGFDKLDEEAEQKLNEEQGNQPQQQ